MTIRMVFVLWQMSQTQADQRGDVTSDIDQGMNPVRHEGLRKTREADDKLLAQLRKY